MKNSVNQHRQERGWSQEDLAAKLGVSRQTIISIEKGKFDPSLPLAFQISTLFEVAIEQIFDPTNQTDNTSNT